MHNSQAGIEQEEMTAYSFHKGLSTTFPEDFRSTSLRNVLLTKIYEPRYAHKLCRYVEMTYEQKNELVPDEWMDLMF